MMKAISRCLALIVALAGLANGGAARAQTALYTANTDTASVPEQGTEHFLQVVNLAQGPGTYAISQIVLSAYFTTTDTQRVAIYFYTGVDTDPTTGNALAHAVIQKHGVVTDLTPPTAGKYAFTISIPPLPVTTGSDGSIGIEVFIADPDPSDPALLGPYSQTAYGRFTPSVPTVGGAAGFVWNDANLDSVFTGAEQTRFGMDNANIRLALVGSLVQPMPSLKSSARNGTTATLTVDSYSGVNYQLQRATSLTAGDWTNVGNAVAGSSGTVLTFTDSDGTDPAAFYRVAASTAGTSGRPAARKTAVKLKPSVVAVPD